MKRRPRRVVPHGRDEVKRALLQAAAELFAARGVAAVSVRDIAARAGVNHGLVHRHFGSKQALERAVLADLTARLAVEARETVPEGATELATMLPTLLASAELDTYLRVLARALLDGEDIRELQQSFPVVEGLRSRIEAAQAAGIMRDDVAADVLSALGVTLGLGWLLFEPFVLAATGLEHQGEEGARAQAAAAWSTLIGGS